nr:MAG TPA: hypothetical protein [Microviridae sp.]
MKDSKRIFQCSLCLIWSSQNSIKGKHPMQVVLKRLL